MDLTWRHFDVLDGANAGSACIRDGLAYGRNFMHPDTLADHLVDLGFVTVDLPAGDGSRRLRLTAAGRTEMSAWK